MRKQTVWFLIVFLGVFFVFLVVAGGRGAPFPKLMAQVGITVGIAPNPYNTLASQLDQEQTQLDQQASDLAAREAAFASSTAVTASTSPVIWYLTVAVAVVALLVILNFYLDWRRSRRISEAEPAAQSEAEKPKE